MARRSWVQFLLISGPMFAMLLNGKQVPVPVCIVLVCRSNLMDISAVELRTDGRNRECYFGSKTGKTVSLGHQYRRI